MIFKRWFKPKWQHADAAIRQQALDALHPNEVEHKNILHELAFNDGAEAVRKAALHRLNDFALWWQASKQDPAERLKLYAEQQLINQLLAGQVSTTLKQKFIEQCNRSSVLEQLAIKETDHELRLALLQRLQRNDLVLQTLAEPDFPDTAKRVLLADITDAKLLEKLSKQLSEPLANEIQQRLTELAELQLKPLRLRKEVTLLLAKLNALRERTELTDIPDLQQALEQQWQALFDDLACLPTEEAQGFKNKYQQISSRLTQWLEPKLAVLAEAKQQAELVAKQQAVVNQLTESIARLTQQVAAQLQQGGTEHQLLINAIEALRAEVAAATLNQVQSTSLLSELTTLQQQCEQLPLIAATLATLGSSLTEFSAKPLPDHSEQLDAAEQQLALFLSEWRSKSKALIIPLPHELKQGMQQVKQQWQNAIEQLKAQQQKGTRQFRSKCAEFKRLHAAGRFKVLFGLFKGISDDYTQLSVVAQAQLEKEFAEISSLHADLASLQYYLATPRKQALLSEIQSLAKLEVSDAKTRADQVKQARANWNALGKADPAEEEQLNQAFDIACEAAFEPCRQLFAKLDAERAAHLAERQQLLTELSSLSQADIEVKTLEQRYRQLTQRWRGAGAVNRRDYQSLQQQFQELSKQIREKINAEQQVHELAKQALIAEAEGALTLTDPAQTAAILKELQQRWKTIGFAGRQQDQALWMAFRAVCDNFFAQRNEEYKLQQEADQQALQQSTQQLAELAEQVAQADSVQELHALQLQCRQFSLPDVAEARQQLHQLKLQIEARLESLQQLQQREDLQALFAALANGELKPEQFPAAYRDALSIKTPALSRPELTVALELLSGKDSGQSSASEKQRVQLALLTLKHNAGQQLTPEQLLQQWLAHGAVAEQEQPLLKRVAALF